MLIRKLNYWSYFILDFIVIILSFYFPYIVVICINYITIVICIRFSIKASICSMVRYWRIQAFFSLLSIFFNLIIFSMHHEREREREQKTIFGWIPEEMGKGSHYRKLVHPELSLSVGFCTKFKYTLTSNNYINMQTHTPAPRISVYKKQ